MDWSKRFIRQWIFANKNIRFKTPILRSDLCDYSDAYIALKVTVMVGGTNDANKRNENLTFNNIATFLDHAYQKSITHLLTMQKILILPCQTIIY